jgi:hypothetical protein
MANGLLDYLSGFGSAAPEYMGSLLGEDAVDKLRGRAATTGIANAVLGYLAAPKNQNLGLGRIIGQSLQAGMTGAQGVYDTAIQDYQTKAKIDEMNRQKAIADRDLARQTQIEGLTPKLFKTNPAQYKETPTGMYVPQAPVAGAEAPNFNQQYVEGAPMRELISPETRTVDTEVLQKIAALSKNPMETLTAQADLIPKLRKAGLVQTTGQQDNPFEMFVTGAQSPVVRNLANTYSKSYLAGEIDKDTANDRILALGKMDESYAAKESSAEDRKAQQAIANQLAERQFQLEKMVAQGQMDQRQATLLLQQEAAQARQDAAAKAFQKPLPSMAMKLESEDLDKALSATTVSNDINKQINSILSSGVNFNYIGNTRLAINAATGATDPETLAYQDYKNFITRVTNESLRLNKGTQTEGDAQRAVKELGSPTSPQAVVRALATLRDLNAQKVADANSLISARRKSSGLTEDRGYSSPEVIEVPKYNPIIFDDKSKDYKKLPVGSIYVNGKTGMTMRKTRN